QLPPGELLVDLRQQRFRRVCVRQHRMAPITRHSRIPEEGKKGRHIAACQPAQLHAPGRQRWQDWAKVETRSLHFERAWDLFSPLTLALSPLREVEGRGRPQESHHYV